MDATLNRKIMDATVKVRLFFKNWDPVNIKTESEWRSRAKKIMRANLVFCSIVFVALVFEYRAYVNRNQETDQD